MAMKIQERDGWVGSGVLEQGLSRKHRTYKRGELDSQKKLPVRVCIVGQDSLVVGSRRESV